MQITSLWNFPQVTEALVQKISLTNTKYFFCDHATLTKFGKTDMSVIQINLSIAKLINSDWGAKDMSVAERWYTKQWMAKVLWFKDSYNRFK